LMARKCRSWTQQQCREGGDVGEDGEKRRRRTRDSGGQDPPHMLKKTTDEKQYFGGGVFRVGGGGTGWHSTQRGKSRTNPLAPDGTKGAGVGPGRHNSYQDGFFQPGILKTGRKSDASARQKNDWKGDRRKEYRCAVGAKLISKYLYKRQEGVK